MSNSQKIKHIAAECELVVGKKDIYGLVDVLRLLAHKSTSAHYRGGMSINMFGNIYSSSSDTGWYEAYTASWNFENDDVAKQEEELIDFVFDCAK